MLAELCYSDFMATITIRNLDETVKRKLQVRAALNGRSMEAEAREVLSEFVVTGANSAINTEPGEGLGTAIHKRFAALGGVELEIPPRTFSEGKSEANGQDEETLDLSEGLGTAIHRLFAPLGGVELEIPPRHKSHRQIPTFEE